MMTLSRWKVGLVLFAAFLGILFTMPNFLPADVKTQIQGFAPTKGLNLGLDLQGGSYLLVGVDTNAMLVDKTTVLMETVRQQLNDDGTQIGTLTSPKPGTVVVQILDPAAVAGAQASLSKLAVPLAKSPGVKDITVSKVDQSVVLVYGQQGINESVAGAVDTSIGIIRKRIDASGTKEPSITKKGLDRIVVEAPGESDPEQLKRLIGRVAKLTFQMVDETVSPADIAAGRVPPGSEALPDDERPGAPPLIVRKQILVSGGNLTKASVEFDQNQRPAIGFSFDGDGAKKFGKVTSENVGHRFAIILDGRVVSAPNIISPITGGSGQITGNFTQEQASELVTVLKAGALPATLKFEQQRTVSAGLGADAVTKGLHSTIIAFCAVVVFMLLAYGLLFGGFSVISLLCNLVLLIGTMSLMQSTLTLPGIAGLILTLAMAVDANVLIYERMRDEVHSGRSLISSLDAGFNKAIETILDANITTLVAAGIMYIFGAGPVKGFAVTLAIGTVTSVFSAVMVTQVCVSLWYKIRRPKVLPISDMSEPKAWPLIKVLPKNTKIKFVSFARFAAILSVIAVCSSLLMASGVVDATGIHVPQQACGGLNCGVDFKGGTALEMNTGTTQIDLSKLRSMLSEEGLRDVNVQGVGNGTDAILRFGSPDTNPVEKVETVKAHLKTVFTNATFSNTEVVGAEVSDELLKGGIIALFVAIGLMMLYVWFRFEWQFGLGAVFALFHDVILVFGMFAIFHLDFDLRAVAAILTIIGYSMNDTVVVFDRLRENLRKYKKMPLAELINLSINETLSRTIITGLTAVMALAGLAVLGGPALFSFSIAMIFGIIIGTYSSIYVASPVILLWGVNRHAAEAEIVDMGGFKGNKKPRELP